MAEQRARKILNAKYFQGTVFAFIKDKYSPCTNLDNNCLSLVLCKGKKLIPMDSIFSFFVDREFLKFSSLSLFVAYAYVYKQSTSVGMCK